MSDNSRHPQQISKEEQSEQISLFNEAKYRAILDSAVDGIITIDDNGVIDSVNSSAELIFGYAAAEIIGKNISMLMPEPYRTAHDQYLQHYLNTHEAKIIGIGREVQGLRKDGSVFDMYLAVSDVAVANRRLFTGIVRDISHLRQTQAALQISEERFRRSQRFSNIGTWDWNIQNGELYWSECIATLFGYQEGELDTTYDNFLNAVHPDDRQLVINAVHNCIEHGIEYNIEHRCMWSNGEVRWLLERGDVIRDYDGKPLHMLGVVQDISRRKQAETELQAAKDEAERANRAKSEFLSSMSHELRTPLNAVLGFAQLLEYDVDLNAYQQESIAEILHAGNHLLKLINEVLDLSKIESGNVSLSLSTISLSRIVNECCVLTQTIADIKGVKIHYRCSAGGFHDCPNRLHKSESCIEPNCADHNLVVADHTRLKQVLLNLLSNAVKYNRDNGSVEVRVSGTTTGMARIEVKDTGCGITEEKLQQLFQPFNRLGAESGTIEGTGIGLVITKRFVEMMSGNICVESKPGVGSTFWIELPRADHDGAGASDTDAFANEAPSQSVIPESGRYKDLKLLVVEDNHTNQKVMENQLKALGYQADIAATATLALELLTRNKYLGVLTDINLPDIDGYEFTKQVRRGDKATGAHTPIIAVTANALQGEAEKCHLIGMDGFLCKPVDLRKLDQALKKLNTPLPDPRGDE